MHTDQDRRNQELARAMRAYHAFVTGEMLCPECESKPDLHEDNGCTPTSVEYSLRCTECGHTWEPNDQ